MENNFIQMAVSAGHVVAYTIGEDHYITFTDDSFSNPFFTCGIVSSVCLSENSLYGAQMLFSIFWRIYIMYLPR